MINIYHCKKCHYEWESIKYEFRCPRCGADVDAMVEMPLRFYNQLLENPDSLEQVPREKCGEDGYDCKPGCAMSTTDRRREIEKLYRTKNKYIRQVIEKYIKCVVVERKDRNFLTARINNGKIEIVDEPSGTVIPWDGLDDDEQWILWNSFNEILEKIYKIRRKK